jgi:hypothetical protein
VTAIAKAPKRVILPAGSLLLGLAVAIGAITVVVVQVLNLEELLDVSQLLTAGYAKALVLAYVLVVGAACVLIATVPRRLLWMPVAAAGGLASMTLLATLSVGAEAGSFAAAASTMLACWQIGWGALHLLRQPRLAAIWPISWLAGTAVLGLALLLAGRLGLLRWWSVGIAVLVLGALALRQLPAWLHWAELAWVRVTTDRLGAGAAVVMTLLLGLSSVWVAAPELMFDALYAKAWLPQEWARLGTIEPLAVHPVLNTVGFAPLLAVPGHLVDADGVGRYMQWLAVAASVTTVWWASRSSSWAPLAAAAVAVTPQIFWQSTTAFDDGLLMLAALGLALAVVSALDGSAEGSPLALGLALGVLAGACIDLKLHLAALSVGLLLGWLVLRGRSGFLAAATGALSGGLLAAGLPFALRWVDLGNPVLPAWNNVFKSDLWPHRNEQFNLPFAADPGELGPLDVLWDAVTDPLRLNEAAPAGSAGLLVPALVIALLLGFRARSGPRAVTALWCGLALACVVWYFQFRYLRYLLPAGAIAVVAVALSLPAREISRAQATGGLAALAIVAILLWPATVGQFWNVPGRDIPWEVAFRSTADSHYERLSMPEREAVKAFDRLAPPGAMALGDAHQRTWLTEGRDLTPDWEIDARLEASGGFPRRSEALDRLQDLGVTWLLVADGGATLLRPYVRTVIADHGRLMYEGEGRSLYKLEDSSPRGSQR